MKKCPYCSAELLDNAEFCLYCMRPLYKKHAIDHKLRKPRFKFAVIGAAAIILTIGIFSFITVKIGYRLKQRDILNKESISEAFLPNTGNFKLNGEIIGNNYGSRNTENDKFSAVKDEGNSKNTATKYTETDSISTSVSSVSDADSSASSGNNSKSGKSEDSGSSVSGAVSSSDISEGQSANSSSGEQSQETLQIWSTRNVDGGVEITGIKTYNSTGHYEIPPQINGKNVVGIGQRAFKYEKMLKSIILPETITYIEEQAFAGCNALSEIVIPKNVTRIGVNAFVPCNTLSDIYIASEFISIPYNAFSDIYNRNCSLTIHASALVMDKALAKALWSADYEEWNG